MHPDSLSDSLSDSDEPGFGQKLPLSFHVVDCSRAAAGADAAVEDPHVPQALETLLAAIEARRGSPGLALPA